MFAMKQKYKKIAALILAVSLLGGCTAPAQPGGDEVSTAQSQQSSEISATEETQPKTDISSDTTEVSLNLYMGRRPMLIGSLP